MFLSTENPPRDHPLPSSSPPSSNLLLRLNTSSSDELGQSHLSNFSIRDYAYSNRKSNIKNSWPFSTKSLQLCSSHGVTDPLPPFQKLSTLTNQFETSSSGKQIVSHAHQTIGVCSQSRNGLFTSKSVSKSKIEIVVAAATSNNNKSKKCGRGMVKTKEDTCGGGLVATASESIMASKICPICKTFSSASNTTLNAHIDQCLSVDSEVPPVSSKPNKPRVTSVDHSEVPPVSSKPRKSRVDSVDSVVPPVSSKPRVKKPQVKVKTLVDIYATAKRCTLEDLDKRNGTQWATVLSCTNRVAADKSDVVSKKRKASAVGVGPVYIDAKGQKLRIITEFSEKKTTSATTLREKHDHGSGEKKSVSQGSKENSKSLRKRGRGKKHLKYIKLTNHKANASEQIPGEGSSKGPRRIFNQRMLAKGNLVSKKLNEKGHKLNALRDQPSDDDDEWSGEDRLVLRGADLSATGSSPLNNKQKLRSQASGRSNPMFESKKAQSRSSKVQIEEKSLARAYVNTVRSKKSLASIQEDKYPPGKSTDASSTRNLSPPFVSNGWRRLSPHVELKRARLDSSDEEEEEEEAGKWESEMTQERELSSDDDYVSGDNGVTNVVLRRSSPSFSAYDDYDDDDDDEETSEEEEEEDNTKRANVSDTPPFNETIPSDERAMYYSEEVENMIACEEEDVRFGSEVRGKGSLYVEVDTIPIPGPPGSFLPSPRGMGFDDHLGNSSVITSQFQSSMDMLDRNSSESPVSAVSPFAAGRLNLPAELSSSSYTTNPMSFCVPSHHETIIAEAELMMAVDKTNNDHVSCCCCQRNERISLNHHQASHLLQRRAASASNAMNLTKSPTHLDPNHPYMVQQEFDLRSKFSSRAVVPPPSPSNSVLRLMGKDLMVMNQGEADSNEEASRLSLKPTPQFHDHPQPCAGTGLYFNTGFDLRNSFESSHEQAQTPKAQQQTQAQASAFRNSFDHVRYFPPS